MLGLLYPLLQLGLDIAAVVRNIWWLVKAWAGDLEVELSATDLRAGCRCGRLWLDSQRAGVAHIQRLVIVKWSPVKEDPMSELVVERDDGLPMILLSADDPGNVVPLAKDLHARLGQTGELCGRWRDLAEEDRHCETLPERRTLRRPLLPGKGWSWLVVHAVGSAGLWQILQLPWFSLPRPMWRSVVLSTLVALQGLILLVNISYLQLSKGTTAESGNTP
jgi:hypothetical protein